VNAESRNTEMGTRGDFRVSKFEFRFARAPDCRSEVHVKRPLILFIFLSFAIFPTTLLPQQKLTTTNLPDFLARYDTNFGPLEAVFKDLTNEDLPMTDEAGQPMARRPLADHLLTLTNLRQTAHQLAAKPDDLVLATTLVIRTESLADDLFDLSQIAYDNDREELGNRLNNLQITMEENKKLLADYLLTLAAEKQSRLQQLEKEVDDLHQKLKGSAK
jgi:hypothetical protein